MTSNRDYLQRLKQIECADATYAPEQSPLVFSRGKGSEVWDVEGKRYIDLCSGFGVMCLGHNHPSVQFPSQEDRLIHGMGDVYPSQHKVELLEKILSFLPDRIEVGAFTVTGSQAIEMAMKTAILKTGKQGFIALVDGYHGLEFGSLAVTSRKDFREGFESWLNPHRVLFVPREADAHVIQQKIDVLEKEGCGLAGILAEPIMGRAGVHPLSGSFLNSLCDLAHRNHALMIFDEIFCGYGRTGRFSFSDQYDCDLTCLGKPMGGGLPLSGVFGTRDAFSGWRESQGEAMHTGTFFGHAGACESGLRVLETFDEEDVFFQVRKKSKRFLEGFAKLGSSFDVRGEGLMLCLDTKIPGHGAQLMDQLRGLGIIALAAGDQGQALTISPAFNISDDLIDESLEALSRLVRQT